MPDQASMPALTVRALKAVPVEVPLNFVLGTSQQAMRQVQLLLIDLETEEGITGRSYPFCYLRAAQPAIMSILGEIEALTKGERADPPALFATITRRFTLIGVQGIVRMALAGFDTACWDAVAKAADKPLAGLLGAQARPILAYNSCGLGIKDDLGALAAEAETLLAMGGFRAVKAAARSSLGARRHCGGARGEEAHRRRNRADGRLQPGTRVRGCTGAWPRTR